MIAVHTTQICPTSNKVHTTRSFAKAICVKNNSQIVLIDTPGLVNEQEMKKHHLESTFKTSSNHSAKNSDLIAVVHDVSNSYTRQKLNPMVLDTLQRHSTVPSILVLNKIDTLKSKRVLLDLATSLTNGTMSGKLLPEKFTSKLTKKPADTPPKEVTTVKPRKSVSVGWSHFSSIFMISSLTGNGLDGVMVRNRIKFSVISVLYTK